MTRTFWRVAVAALVGVSAVGVGAGATPAAAGPPVDNDLITCVVTFGTPAGGATGTCIAPLSLSVYSVTMTRSFRPVGNPVGCADGPTFWDLALRDSTGTYYKPYYWVTTGLPLSLEPVGANGPVLVGGLAGSSLTAPPLVSMLSVGLGLLEARCDTAPYNPTGTVVFTFIA